MSEDARPKFLMSVLTGPGQKIAGSVSLRDDGLLLVELVPEVEMSWDDIICAFGYVGAVPRNTRFRADGVQIIQSFTIGWYVIPTRCYRGLE